MNASDSKRPRLVCRLVRFRCSVFGRAGRTPGADSPHVETCEACQKFFAAGQKVETSLRREAAGAKMDPTQGLEQAIIRAVRFSQPSPRRSSRVSLSVVSLAALAASAALAVFVLHRPPLQNGQADRSTQTADVASGEESTPSRLWGEFEPKAAEVVDQSSLQHEFDSVCSDAQSALAFLQLNFLPSSPKDSFPKHTDASLRQSS